MNNAFSYKNVDSFVKLLPVVEYGETRKAERRYFTITSSIGSDRTLSLIILSSRLQKSIDVILDLWTTNTSTAWCVDDAFQIKNCEQCMQCCSREKAIKLIDHVQYFFTEFLRRTIVARLRRAYSSLNSGEKIMMLN